MEENKRVIGSYYFATQQDYLEAKKEQEAIQYILSKNAVKQPEEALKLYHKIVAKDMFHTVVGMEFLLKLREIALNAEGITKEQLRPITVRTMVKEEKEAEKKSVSETKKKSSEEGKYQLLYEDLKSKRTSQWIIIVFLVVMLAASLVITILHDNTLIVDYRAKVEDEYVEWQETLEEKEEMLNEWEKTLEEKSK